MNVLLKWKHIQLDDMKKKMKTAMSNIIELTPSEYQLKTMRTSIRAQITDLEDFIDYSIHPEQIPEAEMQLIHLYEEYEHVHFHYNEVRTTLADYREKFKKVRTIVRTLNEECKTIKCLSRDV